MSVYAYAREQMPTSGDALQKEIVRERSERIFLGVLTNFSSRTHTDTHIRNAGTLTYSLTHTRWKEFDATCAKSPRIFPLAALAEKSRGKMPTPHVWEVPSP